MTISHAVPGRPVQVLGLLGSLVGLLLVILFGADLAFYQAMAATAAAGLDGLAVANGGRSSSIAFALLKLPIAFVPALILTTGGPDLRVHVIDPNLGFWVVIWSSVVSIAGAVIGVLRR